MSTNPFDYVNSITMSKKDIIRESDNPELAEKDYNSFIVNRQLSYFIDTALYANDMNERHQMPSLLEFDYLINSIRPQKRFSKWAKKPNNDDLEAIREYYQCNYARAEEILELLSSEQVDMIRTTIEKGGVKK